jgi:uncharacterized protein YjbI with pentapeptide repeats
VSHSFGSALIAASIALAMIVGAPQTAQQRAAQDAPDVQIGAVSLDPQGKSVTVPVRFSKEALAGRGVETVHIGVLATTGAETSIVVSNREPHEAGSNQRQTFVLPLTAKEASRLQSAGSWTVAVTLTRERSGDPVVAWFDSATQTAVAPAAAAIAGPAPADYGNGYRDCSGVAIEPGADLSDCFFIFAFLQGMDLSGSDFSNAVLYYSDLRETSLRNATLWRTCFCYSQSRGADLTGANLEETDFHGASVSEGIFDGTRIADARFDDTNLDGASMVGVDGRRAFLSGASLRSVNFTDANLAGAILQRANISRARLTNANLKGAYLASAVLWNADLQGANLLGADAPGTNFAGAVAVGAVFTGANLSGADFDHARLRGTTFQRANLASAVMTFADLSDANLSGANDAGLSLRAAILCNTIMPNGNRNTKC